MEQLLSTLRFDRMTAACAGVATVRQGDFYGFFGGDGLYAPCVWEKADYFREGLAAVRRGGKWGLIGVDGATILPCVCTRRMLLTSRGYGFALQKHRLRVFDRRGELAL